MSSAKLFLVLGSALLAIAPAGAYTDSAQSSQAPAAQAGDAERSLPPPAVRAMPPADPAAIAGAKPTPADKAPGAVPIDTKTYVIGAQDTLLIRVWGEKDFDNQYLVRPDGRISVPFLGEVTAAGMTPDGLRLLITKRLMAFFKDPEVSIQLVGVNSKRFFINGEVLRPGEFPLIVPTTVLQGLVQAGGFRDFANQKKIRILRDGGRTVLSFNYKEVTAGKHLDQNVLLEPGDIIVVP
jgi:polysaccharide biosynthesis/export protein